MTSSFQIKRATSFIFVFASSLVLTMGGNPLGLAIAQNVAPAAGSTAPADDSTRHLFGNPKDRPDFTVWVASSRAGLTFTDSESVDVRVRVSTASEPTMVEYAARETGGPWQTAGTLLLEKGTIEKPLPIELPSRGLFHLNVHARSGNVSSAAETWIAIVFTPNNTAQESPWGMLAASQDYALGPYGPEHAAMSKRLLGASWARLNNPYPVLEDEKFVFGKADAPHVSVDLSEQMKYAEALRDQGIFMMADLQYIPKVFSSRPNDGSLVGDSVGFAGAPPRDYELWERFAETVAAKYQGLVQVWQIGNEPDLAGRYWRGTPEEFAEFTKRSAASLKRGDPSILIAAAGFTPQATSYADKLFQLGLGKYIDILTVHYTDEQPATTGVWKNLLKQHRLDIPLWNSEEKSAIPFGNLAGGQGPFMKFLHVDFGYPEYTNLVRRDLTVLPAGIAFSVGAHSIGTAKWIKVRENVVPGWRVDFFQGGDETIAVFRAVTPSARLFDAGEKRADSVVLDADPTIAGQSLSATDIWGRSRAVPILAGRATLALKEELLFVNGARTLEIANADLVPAPAPEATVIEAEAGRWSPGWGVNEHAGYSSNRLLEIWSDADPGPQGYWAETTFRVPEGGRFELIFAGTTLDGLVAGQGWMSPFAWSVDNGAEQLVETPLPMIKNIGGAPQGISILSTLNLRAGEHRFRLRLLRKSDPPTNKWALWFDAIALRAVAQ